MVLRGPRRWTWHQNRQIRSNDGRPKRRVTLVVSILKGETSVAEAARTAWADRRRGGGLAREVSAGGRERAADEAEGRRGAEGRAGQEAQAEDWRARPRQ